ncbi:MAG: hypothetical protein PWQ31_1571 [Eubacteriales bacterium]|nr:hypothetical protein [Eubacteriales bacterium]
MSYDGGKVSKKVFVTVVLIVSLISAAVGGILAIAFAPALLGYEKPSQIANLDRTSSPPISSPNQSSGSPAVLVAQKVGPAVVGVITSGNGFNDGFPDFETGSGSGFIIDKSGYIVTNEHVVSGASKIIVRLADGRRVAAKLVGSDRQTDLAVLKIDASNLPEVSLGDSDSVKVGETVIAIGNPLGEEFAGTVTQGIVSALNRTLPVGDRLYRVIQTDAAINPGNSGGPLVNTRGEVIGITSAKIRNLPGMNVEGMGFAIPINDARPIIKQIIESGKVVRPWLGIKGATYIEEGSQNKAGVVIAEVIANGPAEEAVIKEGDIIIELDGKKIQEMAELQRELWRKKPGDKVTLKVLREGKEKEIKLTLGKMPQDLQ